MLFYESVIVGRNMHLPTITLIPIDLDYTEWHSNNIFFNRACVRVYSSNIFHIDVSYAF